MVEINELRWQLKEAKLIINIIREGKIKSKAENQELQNINTALDDEATKQKNAQETLQDLNFDLENIVVERTQEIQDINAMLEEEIMEGKAAQERIHEQALLLDIAHDYIMVRDLDSRVIYWNQGAERGYGFTATEAKGQIIHDLLQTQYPIPLEDIMSRIVNQGHWVGEVIHTHKDGMKIVIHSNKTLNRDATGNPVSILEINHDITEKKRDEEMVLETNLRLKRFNAEMETEVIQRTQELQESNATLEEEIMERQAAQEALQDMNLGLENRVAERTGELQDINASLEEEVMERQVAQEALRNLNLDLENIVVERTAELQEINTRLKEEIMERQTIQEDLVTSRDALLKSEMQLRHFSDELLETNKELTSFANSIAHDFRSPMVNIKGFSREMETSLFEMQQLLRAESTKLPEGVQQKMDEVLDREVPEALNFIYSSVDRLDTMVNALLGLARIGKQELVLQEVEMVVLVNEVCQSFIRPIETNNICVTVGLLPKVKANHVAMERIISNLIDNAIKYLMPGRPGQIEVNCNEEDERYIFFVEDNGRGIAETDHEKVFQVFKRAGQEDVKGDGMGLAYVRTVVRQLGGRVWCESELGYGTKIFFTMPKKCLNS